jgi:iron complex transport system substrate-binding protein
MTDQKTQFLTQDFWLCYILVASGQAPMRKKLVYFLVALLFLIAGFLTSIHFFRAEPNQKNPGEFHVFSPEEEQGEKLFKRIICGTPSITEIVFALGEGARVVGVSQFSSYPLEAKSRANIGGLINPNKERILSLRPDLFLTQGKNETLGKFCAENDIAFLSLRIETLEDLEQVIQHLGTELGAEEKADHLIKDIRSEISNVRSKVDDLPRKKVFLTMGHTAGNLSGLLTTGQGTFLDELLTVAGGENVFADTPVRYPQISKESLVMRDPEVIIEVFTGRLSDRKKELLRQDWMRLSTLPAAKTDNIHFLDEDYLLIPGVRIAQTALKLAMLIHPEAFDEKNTP